MAIVMLALASAFLSLLFAGGLSFYIMKRDAGSPKMKEISDAIKSGAAAYLQRQYKTMIPIIIAISIILAFSLGYLTALNFVVGAFLSGLAGYIGMNISVRTNARTANAAKDGLDQALAVAFRGGAVTGMIVVGLGLLGVTLLYQYTGNLNSIIGFGFGASLVSLFMRVGGGIYTKAADVGADLVGKVEKGIPEDDPRNPAVIADNVGDNVGDNAGMAADLFESYVITIIAAMLLGIGLGVDGALFPLAIGSAAIFASIIGTFFVRLGKNKNIWSALNRGILATAAISTVLFYFITNLFFNSLSIFLAAVVGLVTTVVIGFITEKFTAADSKAVKDIAQASTTGAGTNIIAGLSIGMRSTFPTMLLIVGAILAAYYFAGVYGIAIAALGMLSVTGIIVAVDSFGPITDNAGGIAEMSGLPEKVRKITDALDAVGNTTKAVTKGFAIGSAALAALSLFAAYAEATNLLSIDILKPSVVAGLFIGGGLTFLFSSFAMAAVGRAAFSVVEEVRRQWRTIKGIMQGKAKPDYAKVVDITTQAALKEFMAPGLIAIISPVIVGFVLGAEALGGMLAGGIVTGLLLAIFLANSGAAWDNAKKYIEAGNFGGKGSDAHKAAVVGDTVGDPAKDTAGPSLNPLIKVLNMISLLFAALFVTYSIL